MIQVPVTKNGNSDVKVTLSGETFILQFNYNSRNTRIYMSILNRTNTPLLQGLRLIENLSPDASYATGLGIPKGIFIDGQAKDSAGEISTLGNTGIDEIFTLVFLPNAEVVERGLV